MSFGQLLRGEANEAEKELRHLFTPLKIRDAFKKGAHIHPALMPTGKRVLNAMSVPIYGIDMSVLLDMGTVSNLVSAETANHLKVDPKATKKAIKIPDC